MTVESGARPDPLYVRLGGWGGIAVVSDLWCDRALADAQLAPLFADADPAALRREQMEFLIHLAGGPVGTPAYPLPPLLARPPVSAWHSERVLSHLLAALVWANVPRGVIEEVWETVASLVPRTRPAEPPGDL
jgi:truncated hemoglobin YjbI